MPPARSSWPFLLLALLAGCRGEITESNLLEAPGADASLVSTGEDSYTLTSSLGGLNGRIDISISNSTGETISLLNCNGAYGYVLERRTGSGWVRAWSPVLPLCLSPPIEIPAGGVLEDTVGIYAGRRGSNLYPQFAVDQIDGTYRLVVGSAYWDYDGDGPPWGDALPLAMITSEPFELRTN